MGGEERRREECRGWGWGGKDEYMGEIGDKSQKVLKECKKGKGARENEIRFVFYFFFGMVFATLNFPICNKKFFSENSYLLKGTS